MLSTGGGLGSGVIYTLSTVIVQIRELGDSEAVLSTKPSKVPFLVSLQIVPISHVSRGLGWTPTVPSVIWTFSLGPRVPSPCARLFPWSAALPLAPVHLRDHGMADGRVHCFRGVPARHAIRPLLPACDDQLGCRSCTAPLSSQPPAARGTDSASRCRSPASRRAIISHTLAPRLKSKLQFLPTRWSVQVVPDFAASE